MKLRGFESLSIRRAAWPSQYVSNDSPVHVANELAIETVHFPFAREEVVGVYTWCLVEINESAVQNAECIETKRSKKTS